MMMKPMMKRMTTGWNIMSDLLFAFDGVIDE
jgi:hypothetical protein